MLDLEQRSVPPTLTRNADHQICLDSGACSRLKAKFKKSQATKVSPPHHYYHHHYQHDHHTSSVQPLRKQKPKLVPQIPAQAYRCGSPSSASAASFCQSRYSSLPLSCFRQTIHPERSWAGELTASPPPFVSNSGRHFDVLWIQLHLYS